MGRIVMDFVTTALFALLGAVAVGTVTFAIGYRMKRYDVVDAAWGWMFIVPAWVAALLHNMEPHAVMIAFIVTAWGLRLSYYIIGRIRTTTHEDERYVALRSKWPKRYTALQIFVRIYILQAVLAVIIATPVIGIIASTAVDGVLLAAGVAVSVLGIGIEVIADRQLKSFIGKPENNGKLMQTGLWRYSRHPNYFGETLMWWGMGIAAIGSSIGLFGVVGPAVITLLLLFVSGVPPAERRAQSKAGWNEYKRKTPVLVPFIRL